MENMRGEAFLGSGWEEVRLKIPKGKYRVVLLDFWDYTATVINDFDTLEEAIEFIEDLRIMGGEDSYTEYVIYNDRGEEVSVRKEGLDIPVPEVEDVDIHVERGVKYVAVALFIKNGEFEDLLFYTAGNLDEAKDLARKLKEENEDASRIIVLDREGKVVWEEK